jgi:hypothetical protein
MVQCPSVARGVPDLLIRSMSPKVHLLDFLCALGVSLCCGDHAAAAKRRPLALFGRPCRIRDTS